MRDAEICQVELCSVQIYACWEHLRASVMIVSVFQKLADRMMCKEDLVVTVSNEETITASQDIFRRRHPVVLNASRERIDRKCLHKLLDREWVNRDAHPR